MKTSKKLYLEIVCADIRNKKLYVTSFTMRNSKDISGPAAQLINQFKTKYPTFTLEVNDAFFAQFLAA